ncbi:tyrosine-type recombinase/integrase [Bernardetia sp. ABR2-2B]|uniref:tyrosine-type recombinase/integrase n=1 Tax=Bernardetia sp. ABR2-2B TaxID=3127472 RepID=UPI0030D1AFD2
MLKPIKPVVAFHKPSNLYEGIEVYLAYKTNLNGNRTDERIKSISNIMLLTLQKLGIDTLPIENATTGVLYELLAAMKKDRGVSNNRYNDYRNFLQNAFHYFYEKEWINRNNALSIPRLRKESTQYHKPYNDKEIKKIYDYLRENNVFLLRFIEFFRYTGLRPNEIRQLRVGNIDTQNWLIRPESLTIKTRIERTIEIPIEFIKELKKWNIDKFPSSYYLFSNQSKGIGKKIASKNTFCHAFKKVKDALELDKFQTLYSFRATTALDVYKENNYNPQCVQDYLGHTNGESTYNYLSRPDARVLRKRNFVFPILKRF